MLRHGECSAPHWQPNFAFVIYNGKRSECSPILSVVIRVINKVVRSRSRSPICLITSMITDRIGRHKVLLPVNHNCNKGCYVLRYSESVCLQWNNNNNNKKNIQVRARWRVLSNNLGMPPTVLSHCPMCGHFHVVVVQWWQRNVQKRDATRAELLFCLLNPLLFRRSRCRYGRGC